jgi:hypothetical protein
MVMTDFRTQAPGIAIRFCAVNLLLIASGCGNGNSKPTAHVSGTVTINGQPLPADAEGTIMFRPAAEGMAKTAGLPIITGKYDSPQTPAGEVTVYFGIQKTTGKQISDAGGPLYPEFRNIVPAGDAKGIELTITSDNSEQNFDLEYRANPSTAKHGMR